MNPSKLERAASGRVCAAGGGAPLACRHGRRGGAPRLVLVLCALVLAWITTADAQRASSATPSDAAIMQARPPEWLSEFGFFADLNQRAPNAGVIPYDLNTALYSDGALKFRYVYVPPGEAATYNGEGVFEFPVGTALIKTFAFAADMRTPGDDIRMLETRVLIRRADGWVAYPYVWNDAQTDARLSPIGADIPVSFTDDQGAAIALDWAVPNVNQCRGCHERAGELTPIGPSARNLNRDFDYATGAQNQLAHWLDAALLNALPASAAPRVPSAYDPESGSLDRRARAYLDVNCAHCHNPQGPAHTSGLDLSWSQDDPAAWGVLKRPVAAGRGSAGFEYAIEPGHPERSILLHRMSSTDPGVMMPELGRQLVDDRGVALMRDWIAAMDAQP